MHWLSSVLHWKHCFMVPSLVYISCGSLLVSWGQYLLVGVNIGHLGSISVSQSQYQLVGVDVDKSGSILVNQGQYQSFGGWYWSIMVNQSIPGLHQLVRHFTSILLSEIIAALAALTSLLSSVSQSVNTRIASVSQTFYFNTIIWNNSSFGSLDIFAFPQLLNQSIPGFHQSVSHFTSIL